jgi:hypothetical protein
MPVRYPRDAASELLDRLTVEHQKFFASWQGDKESLRSARADYERVRPLPRQQDLAELLDVAFLASIAQEEGRAVTFTLLYCDPLLAIESQWPMIRFASDLPFSVEHIRKLSPATDPSTVDIGVFRQDGPLFLWGVAYLRRVVSGFPGVRQYPPGLSITSRQPGVLVVREDMRDVLVFSGAHDSRRTRWSCRVWASPVLGPGIRLSTLLPRPICQCSPHYRYGLRCLRRRARRNSPGSSIGDDAQGTRQTTIRRTRCVSTDPRVRVVRP